MVKPRSLHLKNGLLLAEMIRHGYTIASLAKAIDVHYLTLWRIVNQHHRPSQANAEKIAALLETTPAKLGLDVWQGPTQQVRQQAAAETEREASPEATAAGPHRDERRDAS